MPEIITGEPQTLQQLLERLIERVRFMPWNLTTRELVDTELHNLSRAFRLRTPLYAVWSPNEQHLEIRGGDSDEA